MSRELLSIMQPTFVVIDVETTGLDFHRDRIIEIAAIKYTLGEQSHAIYSDLITINSPIPAFITELTGISESHLRDNGVSIDYALDRFVKFIADHRLVAFNAQFDISFINMELSRAGKKAIRNDHACALSMARRAWPDLKSHKLADLAAVFNLPVGRHHRAEDDAALAVHIYVKAAYTLQSAY